MCSANLPDKIAIAIDSQMDDGVTSGHGARAPANRAQSAGRRRCFGLRGNRNQHIRDCRQI
jgi:hypothetical protein